MGAIFIFYGSIFLPMVLGAFDLLGISTENISGFKAFAAIIATTMITNGFFEVICAVVLSCAVLGSVYAVGSRKSKISKFEE